MAFLPALTPLIAVAGTAAGIGGSVIQGIASAKAAEHSAQMADLERQALLQEADFQERQERRRMRLLQGEANAVTAASGIAPTSGTALLLELDRAKEAEIQSLYHRYRGGVHAAGKQMEASLYRARKGFDLAAGGIRGTTILSDFIASPVGQEAFRKVGGFF